MGEGGGILLLDHITAVFTDLYTGHSRVVLVFFHNTSSKIVNAKF
jgi:hypothetical protein